MDATGSRDLKLWFADGTNYPGQDDIRRPPGPAGGGAGRGVRRGSAPDQRMLLEYKLFEPSFYTTDVPDWGTSLTPLPGHWAERPWSWSTPGTTRRAPTSSSSSAVLLRPGRLGGFDFNCRFYADDDLMVGAADPFQLFRILYEVVGGGRGYADADGGHRVHARPVPQHRAEDPRPDPLRDERAGGDGQGAAGRPRTRWRPRSGRRRARRQRAC